jgi:lysyl-tRNA synthetase class 2
VSAVQAHAERIGLNFDPAWGQGKIVQELFEALVEEQLTVPTFVRDYPAETSPLTRPHRDDPRLAEKWDLIVFGMELGTAYSELIDPILQRQRLTEQSLQAAGGDPEAMELDEDFLRALEYAMPPTGGLGLGVDRVVMLLTGGAIRSTLTFPFTRPERSS